MPGAGRLRVDYEGLEERAKTLKFLQNEFSGLEDKVEPCREAVGDERVSGALFRFATNWYVDREEIVEGLGSVAAFASGAAECYRETDEEVGDRFDGN